MRKQSAGDPHRGLVEQIFNGSLSLMAILIAIVGLMLALYRDIISTDWLERPFFWMIWGLVAAVLLTSITAAISLTQLIRDRFVLSLIVIPLYLILALVFGGIPTFVWFITIFSNP